MEFIKWLISSLIGIFIGAALIGVVLVCVIIGPALAIAGFVGFCIFLLILFVKEFIDSKSKK